VQIRGDRRSATEQAAVEIKTLSKPKTFREKIERSRAKNNQEISKSGRFSPD